MANFPAVEFTSLILVIFQRQSYQSHRDQPTLHAFKLELRVQKVTPEMDEAELACLPDTEGSGGHSPANDFHAAGNSRKKIRVSLSLEAIVIEEANKPSLARQSSGGLARQSSGGLTQQSSGGRASDGEGSGGRRNSWERDGFGGIFARKRPRTPRSLSPTGTGELFSAKTTTLLGNAVDREDNRLDRSARAEAKKRGKKKRTPDQLMGEIGCSCAQCMAATNILSRGRSSGEQSIYLDEKSWLECFDRKHRYGSNLRHYYHSWRDQGMPGKHFWAWLDESRPLPDLACLPREKLQREVVTYLSAEERVQFQVQVEDGLLIVRALPFFAAHALGLILTRICCCRTTMAHCCTRVWSRGKATTSGSLCSAPRTRCCTRTARKPSASPASTTRLSSRRSRYARHFVTETSRQPPSRARVLGGKGGRSKRGNLCALTIGVTRCNHQ